MNRGRRPVPLERRTVPREPAGWLGRYQVAGRPELGWGECRVLDVSPVGVGLELFGPWPRDGVDAELLVCLEPVDRALRGHPAAGHGTELERRPLRLLAGRDRVRRPRRRAAGVPDRVRGPPAGLSPVRAGPAAGHEPAQVGRRPVDAPGSRRTREAGREGWIAMTGLRARLATLTMLGLVAAGALALVEQHGDGLAAVPDPRVRVPRHRDRPVQLAVGLQQQRQHHDDRGRGQQQVLAQPPEPGPADVDPRPARTTTSSSSPGTAPGHLRGRSATTPRARRRRRRRARRTRCR